MQNHKIILHLESTTSRIEKEKIILNQMENKNKIFLDGLKLAYDKLLTFGVKKIPISSSDTIRIVIIREFKRENHN